MLHACGDVSGQGGGDYGGYKFAPRMWSCFYARLSASGDDSVCSTHVEMFPFFTGMTTWRERLLHACGDVSEVYRLPSGSRAFAPRMWRCFRAGIRDVGAARVCSTHVEMFPPTASWSGCRMGLLHACGDVSVNVSHYVITVRFAPRMWRCCILNSENG